MTAHPLDNPIWNSLTGRHADLALGEGEVRRYPAVIAPFLGVSGPAVEASAALAGLLPPGDTALLLGVAPKVSADWELLDQGELAQMVCEAPLPAPEGPAPVALGPEHQADLLALTALVYPHYFRRRTPELGRYFGIYLDQRLAAIIGERLGPPGFREISAVCTHPDYSGRGLARGLLAMLSNDNLARGLTPFLHVSLQNERAVQLYLRNGYTLRRRIGFWSLRAAG